ncbi:MAG: hypothetical protein HOP08_14095 [Cyclobacteriaceae bacterium]|nr:hypothetical protein [Cyclobacteriaceae bacterium]
MDLLLFLLAFMIGFGIFISSAYFLAKVMFPRLEDEEAAAPRKYNEPKSYLPKMNKHHNPYFFAKNHPYSYK